MFQRITVKNLIETKSYLVCSFKYLYNALFSSHFASKNFDYTCFYFENLLKNNVLKTLLVCFLRSLTIHLLWEDFLNNFSSEIGALTLLHIRGQKNLLPTFLSNYPILSPWKNSKNLTKKNKSPPKGRIKK